MGCHRCKLTSILIIIGTSILIDKCENVCNTKQCLNTAETLLKYMNPAVKPCDDFYQYACGNFHETQLLSYEMPFTSVLSIRYADYLEEIKNLLEDGKRLSESESLRKSKDIYKACMNSTVEDEIQDVKQYIAETLGCLPLVMMDEWDANLFNWQDVFIYLAKNGFKNTGIFDIKLEILNSSPVFYIEYQPAALHTVLGNFSTSFDEANTKLREILQKFFELFEIPINNEEDFALQIEQVVKFMQLYMKLPTYARPLRLYTIEDLLVQIPEFNWIKLFQRLVNRHLTPDSEVYVEGLEWLQSVINLIHDTTKKTIANYLVLNTIMSLHVSQQFSLSLQSKIRCEIYNGTSVSSRYELEATRSDFCLQHVGQISNAVKAVHFKKYKLSELKYSVKLIALQIHETFFSLFYASNPNEQLLADVERFLSNNITDIPLEISVDEKYLDDLVLDTEHEKLIGNLISGTYFQSKKFRVEEWTKGIKSLGFQQPDVKYIGSLEQGLQKIVVPGSLLNDIVYSVDRNSGFNFGTLGFKISEGLITYLKPTLTELFHRRPIYNADPVSETPVYMTSIYSTYIKNLPEFQQWPKWKEQELYKTILFQSVTAKLTYSAYQDWLLNHTDNTDKLPGIELNSTQLFWLGYATLNCATHDETYTSLLPYYTPYENKLSVLTVIHLVPDFKEIFNCQSE